MLPFLKKRMMASVIIKKDKDGIDDGSSSMSEDEGLKQACSDILRSISAGDADQMASAFRAAFQICDSQPHEEYDGES